MPMHWSLEDTELAKKRDADEWHREAWKFIFSNLNPNKPHTDEKGIKWMPIEYDLVWLLTTWTYTKKGGNYGERGKEMLEGKYFVFEEKDIEAFKKDMKWRGDDRVLKELVGLRVWATQKVY